MTYNVFGGALNLYLFIYLTIDLLIHEVLELWVNRTSLSVNNCVKKQNMIICVFNVQIIILMHVKICFSHRKM